MFSRLLWLVFIVVVGGMLWFRIKRFMRKHKSSQAPMTTFQTVRCAHCGIHLPEQEALREDGNSFCCVAHQKAFKAR
ncbi:MAG: PP0621 family protein [Thiotrichaceae bacterium]|nr:PP0621 family protein [Thiotrichaceae bacterium]